METRRHLRIRQLLNVTWSMNGEDMTGRGQIINISDSGVLMHIDDSFKPLEKCVLSIDPSLIEEENTPFLNKKGKVVWFRRIQTPRYKYLCGVEFFNEPNIDQVLHDWIEEKTNQLAQTMNASILNNYAN